MCLCVNVHMCVLLCVCGGECYLRGGTDDKEKGEIIGEGMRRKGRGGSGEWCVCACVCAWAYTRMNVCAHVYKCVYVKELNWNCPTQEKMFFLEAVGFQIKRPVRA